MHSVLFIVCSANSVLFTLADYLSFADAMAAVKKEERVTLESAVEYSSVYDEKKLIIDFCECKDASKRMPYLRVLAAFWARHADKVKVEEVGGVRTTYVNGQKHSVNDQPAEIKSGVSVWMYAEQLHRWDPLLPAVSFGGAKPDQHWRFGATIAPPTQHHMAKIIQREMREERARIADGLSRSRWLFSGDGASQRQTEPPRAAKLSKRMPPPQLSASNKFSIYGFYAEFGPD